ncbi:hypothetical protein KO465_00820 [Candidatus Micrarchaeota archaeon]|nr:hypothetical protein [Candidatus Micrarchaeota archaeon]
MLENFNKQKLFLHFVLGTIFFGLVAVNFLEAFFRLEIIAGISIIAGLVIAYLTSKKENIER